MKIRYSLFKSGKVQLIKMAKVPFNKKSLFPQGGDGTALTHWEKRIFQDEAMTGTVHTKDPAYSRITFALLEDTGWYKPNYQFVRFTFKGCVTPKQYVPSRPIRYPGVEAWVVTLPEKVAWSSWRPSMAFNIPFARP